MTKSAERPPSRKALAPLGSMRASRDYAYCCARAWKRDAKQSRDSAKLLSDMFDRHAAANRQASMQLGAELVYNERLAVRYRKALERIVDSPLGHDAAWCRLVAERALSNPTEES